MLKINDFIIIPDQYVVEEFFGSSGPGGQNVNKVATAVRLRLHLASLPVADEVKSRWFARLSHHLNESGELVCVSRIHRTQMLNRQEAAARMELMLRQALQPVKKRRPSAPTRASERRRLEAKKMRSEIKSLRRDQFD